MAQVAEGPPYSPPAQDAVLDIVQAEYMPGEADGFAGEESLSSAIHLRLPAQEQEGPGIVEIYPAGFSGSIVWQQGGQFVRGEGIELQKHLIRVRSGPHPVQQLGA